MSNRAKTAGPESQTTMVDSAVLQFKVDYEQTKQLPIGKSVLSDVVPAGGHLWRIECYPRGDREADKGEYVSIFLQRVSTTRVKVVFDVFLLGGDGQPSATDTERGLQTIEFNSDQDNNFESWGWNQFVKRSIVEKNYAAHGHFTFVCAIMVVHGNPIPVPPSDIGIHLGSLLDHKDGTDVSFVIDGRTFRAHRAVLAARSPVFRAEFFGSMAEATMSSITLHDITPAVFKVMLQFMYSDALPVDKELVNFPIEIFLDLLAAADRYALDRLKLVCAQKLWDNVSVDTVATTLVCSETYNCPELKNRCFDFFAVEENFKEAVFTEGFVILVQKFPWIAAELKKRVRT